MRSAGRSSLGTRVYGKMMGIGGERLTLPSSPHPSVLPRLRDVIYYAYQKGFWPFFRGLLFRPRLRRCGGRFFLGRQARILFPSQLSVGRNVVVGDYVFMNCYGLRGVTLGSNVRLREFGWVQVTSHLSNPGDGLDIGDDTYIGPHCVLGSGAGISIGNDVMFGAYVQLLAENHAFSDPDVAVSFQGVTRQGIKIGDGCWLGNGVIVLDGVHIEEHSVIGAGSVVTRDVPARSVAVGNPARIIKTRSER